MARKDFREPRRDYRQARDEVLGALHRYGMDVPAREHLKALIGYAFRRSTFEVVRIYDRGGRYEFKWRRRDAGVAERQTHRS